MAGRSAGGEGGAAPGMAGHRPSPATTAPDPSAWETAATVLRLAAQLVDAVQDGVAAKGFDDVRPAHGFAFVRIAAGGATTADVAAHLGVTKQAAAQLVEHLVQQGYVRRLADPTDRRSRPLELTPRGRACTRAAEEAAAAAVEGWGARLGPGELSRLQRSLRAVTADGGLRPSW